MKVWKKLCSIALASVITLGSALVGQAAEESMIMPYKVVGSSTLQEAGFNHDAWNLFDGSFTNAWTEGVYGNGVGEYVEIGLPEEVKVTGIIIYPGFLKSEDLFYKNGAPTMIEISAAGGRTTIDCSNYANSYADASRGCYFWFGEEIEHNGSISLTVRGVREGWKYADTCISEVVLFGTGVPNDGIVDPEMKDSLVTYAYWLHQAQNRALGLNPGTLTMEELTAEAKAMGVHWLQYHGLDYRVESLGEYNTIEENDLWSIWYELYGSVSIEDMEVFQQNYMEYMEGDTLYLYGTGDFGALGEYYFALADVMEESEEEIIMSGNVMVWDGQGEYVPMYRYEVKYSVEEDGLLGCYQFEEMSIW